MLFRVYFLAPGLGFEPRYTASEAVVLPLDDPGMWPYNRFFDHTRQCPLLTSDIGFTLTLYETIQLHRYKRPHRGYGDSRLCSRH